jgi:aminomethyltransferase
MVDFGGWHMPLQYGAILEEVQYVRQQAGLFDLSHMGRVRVTGPDHVAYLDHLVSNYCAKIPVGSIRYAFLCREDGNPIDDLLVYRGEDEIYLVINAGNAPADLAWMREHTSGFDVTVEDLTADQAMLAVQGPSSPAVLQPFIEGLELASLKYYRFGFGTLCGIPNVRVSRTGYTGEIGYELYVPASDAERVFHEILEGGKAGGLRPIGLGARDTLRLEAGMALYGHEVDPEHNPLEAGCGFAVSFAPEKGDWIGRAALEAVRENPTRKLVGVTTAGPRIPRQGQELYQGDRPLGTVASGSRSPTLDTNIATAYVPLDVEPGDSLELDFRGKRQTALVCTLPFYSKTRS